MQKRPIFALRAGAVLCHNYCHTGTEFVLDSLKLSELVRKRFFEMVQALDRAKRTARSRDMRFCVKTVPIQYLLRKGLRRKASMENL